MAQISLGDARAEQDYSRRKGVFYESPDYRTLIESDVKSIVVGRRGVGKSALYMRLTDYYQDANKVEIVRFAPDEHEVLAFRPIAKFFGSDFKLVRAATRLVFRYALLMEIVESLSRRYKFKQCAAAPELLSTLDRWRQRSGLLSRSRLAIERAVEGVPDAETRVGALAHKLEISEIEAAVASVLDEMGRGVIILVDRLDEGYEPDDSGIAIVDGFLHASIDLRDKLRGCRSIVFLRDNIFRAVEHHDGDFSRNLEQSVLRLHWDERSLLTFVANRIREATSIRVEKSIKVWDSVTQGELQGEAGFHAALRLTLYRPRDLLLLLNDAFRLAAARSSFAIEPTDLDVAAKSISENRFRDLEKEYGAQFPGLGVVTKSFIGHNPKVSVNDAKEFIGSVIFRDDFPPNIQQQFSIYSDPIEVLRDLYSVGFIGVKEKGAQSFVFCHDGRKPDRDFAGAESLMVHPCYWIALGLARHGLDEQEASEIYDEYDVTVTSETPEQRVRLLGQLEAELRKIDPGLEGASEFEQWCLKAVRVLFSGGLRNIELHPNKSSLQRRDIVGTNHGPTPFWRRVLESYESRQVIFEVKNFSEMNREQFWQMNSYLSQEYGAFGIILTRGEDINLRRDKELAWVRELKNQHGKVVLIIPAKFLVGLLHKVRNPAKHDAADDALDRLLDTYCRTYFGEQASSGKRQRSKVR